MHIRKVKLRVFYPFLPVSPQVFSLGFHLPSAYTHYTIQYSYSISSAHLLFAHP